MQRCEDNVAARLNGNALQPLSDVSVTVTDDRTGLKATLYSDDGVTQITQPLVTDDNGYYGFYAANGEYTLSFSGLRIATFTRKIVLADPSDNPYATRAELAAGSGATLVKRNGVSVAELFDTIAGPDPIASAGPNEYSGNMATRPLLASGASIAQQVWKTPVHIDLACATNPVLPVTGPIFKFGNTGLTSGPFWSQDSYILRNGTFANGPSETVSFEPWTSHTAVVENLRILNSGAAGKWHVNFKQQNWWPIVRGNTFADYADKKGNFCKAIDDEGDAALRYSGNSRVVFYQNRLKWLGAQVGGIGFYGSAVGNVLRDNAMEGASIAAILGYPSTGTIIDGLYTEMPFGSQVAVMLGDQVAAPNNTISLVKANNIYANLHGLGTNRVFKVGNTQVVVNDLAINGLFVTNIPTGAIPPLVDMNDLPGQKVRAGNIVAEDMPLIPLLSNHVAVLDTLHATIPTFNGDMVYADSNSVALPANTATAVARNWYAKSTAAGTFDRGATGGSRRGLRQSRYLGVFGFASGSTNLVVYELPRANLYEGENITAQWLLNSNVSLTHTVTAKIYNPDGSRSTLRSKTVTSDASWHEHTMTFYVDTLANAEGSLLVLELAHTAPSAATLYVAGMRFNRGSFGLSSRADTYSYAETAAKLADYTWIAP